MLKTKVIVGISLMAVMAAAFGVTVLFAGDTNEPNKPSAVGLLADANQPSDANKVSVWAVCVSDSNEPNKPASTCAAGDGNEPNTPVSVFMGTDSNEPNTSEVSSRVLTLK